MDWEATAAAAAIATAVATMSALLLSLFWRHLDKPVPGWAPYSIETAWEGIPQADSGDSLAVPVLTCEVANVGAGTGLQVFVQGLGCRARLQRVQTHRQWGVRAYDHPFEPAVMTGETFRVRVMCLPQEWETAEVWIMWTGTTAVRRRRRHVSRVPLRSIGQVPPSEGPAEWDDEKDQWSKKLGAPPRSLSLSGPEVIDHVRPSGLLRGLKLRALRQRVRRL